MRRDQASVDQRIAVSGGRNSKALNLTIPQEQPSLGPWRLLYGDRVGAQARLYISPWGFDSPCLHPFILSHQPSSLSMEM